MLRSFVVLAAAGICLAAATTPMLVADKNYLTKQKSIYQLFWHADQPTTVLPELYQKARSWSIGDHLDSYDNQAAVQDFLLRWKHGMLPRDEIFSVFYPEHLVEAKLLFEVLYHAKDFNTFYNTAVWARFNMNEKLYTYALSVAVIHRPDTKYMKLPPLYETMPHYYFNSEVIQQAYRIKMGDLTGVKKGVVIKHLEGGVNDIVINANYSGWYTYHGYLAEEQLSYFTEDIGLNSLYFYFKHETPFWMNSSQHNLHKDIRGEVYYYGHKQLLARYYMERLSNGMSEIENFDWRAPIQTAYYPTIVHPNGLPFPQRPTGSYIPTYKYEYVQEVDEIETRLKMAIDSGYVIDKHLKPIAINTHEGLNMLANIIEGNEDSINLQLYGSLDHLAKNIFGYNLDPVNKYMIVPSALQTFTTSMRDPAFYRIYKKIISGYLNKWKATLPMYTQEQLLFPGVKIESVAIDKLTTFFDHFDSDISNALPVKSHKEATELNVKVRQQRLNHKPFTYHITVNSDKNVKAMVRVFLGPKYDSHGYEIDMTDNWMHFLHIDEWMLDLKSGMNKIERSGHQSPFLYPDDISGPVYWNKIEKALESGEQLMYSQQIYGFPDRLILPKGKKEGMAFKLFVTVTEVVDGETKTIESPIWGPSVVDGRPMGWPLDRPINMWNLNVPNMFMKDVMIYHKHAEELNLTV